jgi:hypothetical protein
MSSGSAQIVENPINERLNIKHPGGSSHTSPSAPTAACIEPPSESEIPPKALENITDFQKWLNDFTQTRRLLLKRVIPVNNTSSLFMFTAGGSGTGFPYLVRIFDDVGSEFDIKMHIEKIEREELGTFRSQQFLGIHRLAGNAYLVVFYYEKQ